MNIKRKAPLLIGIVALVIGGIFALNYFGIVNIPIPGLTTSIITSAGHTLGMETDITRVQYPLTLSAVSSGYTYKWSTVTHNTGTATWADAWINVRLGVNGATQTSVTCASNPASCSGGTVGGSFYVETCGQGTDVVACREDIQVTTGWNFKWSSDGNTWYTCGQNPGLYTSANGNSGGVTCGGTKYTTYSSCYTNKVCSVDVGPTNAGSSKTIYWQLTVPASYTTGSYPFIIQTMAYADAGYAVAGAKDILTIGSIAGDVSLALLGFVSILVGAGFVAAAFI